MSHEAWAFILSCGCGFCAITLLGGRNAIRGGWLVNILSDVMWWVIFIGITGFCLWQTVSMRIRVFYLIGIALGGILAYFTLMKPMERLVGVIIKIVYKIIEFILKILLTPGRFLYKILIVHTMQKVCKNKGKGGRL